MKWEEIKKLSELTCKGSLTCINNILVHDLINLLYYEYWTDKQKISLCILICIPLIFICEGLKCPRDTDHYRSVTMKYLIKCFRMLLNLLPMHSYILKGHNFHILILYQLWLANILLKTLWCIANLLLLVNYW